MPLVHVEGDKYAQLAAVNMMNVKAFVESARYIIVRHGGHTDAKVDGCIQYVCFALVKPQLTAVPGEASMRDVASEPMWSRYVSLWAGKPLYI